MKRLVLIILCLISVVPSFGQFRNGMMDRTGADPVFRDDLNLRTAHTLLNADDYQKYLLGDRLIKSGVITFASGMTVAGISGVIMLCVCGAESVNLLSSVPSGASSINRTSASNTFKVSRVCAITGSVAALAGLGLMIPGYVMDIKITNKYYREHPYCGLSINASPAAMGIAFNF